MTATERSSNGAATRDLLEAAVATETNADAAFRGLVLGTEQESSSPLGFSVFVAPDRYLQLDDVVQVRTALPDGRSIDVYGVVDEVSARHEGVQLTSDVSLVREGVLPAEPVVSAHVAVTRRRARDLRAADARGRGAPRRWRSPRTGAVLRRHAAQVPVRPRARRPRGRRTGVRQPRLPRRAQGRARQHLGHLRRGDEDVVRDVPALRAVRGAPPGRPDDERAGADLQREGRGPAVPRSAEPAPRHGR